MHPSRRLPAIAMLVSAALAAAKVTAGLAGNSTATVADGLESASDVLASGLVLIGLTLAAKPPDKEHPYGHGRGEILSGLFIGMLLSAGGALISYGSIIRLHEPPERVAAYVLWPLAASLVLKTVLATVKFRRARSLDSSSLLADAWNDTMDCFSAVVAMSTARLTMIDPVRFPNADRYGGFVVGLIVITAGVRVARSTVLQLMDTMPEDRLIRQIREIAAMVPGSKGVEKCYARKTGLQYHVDLHLEVDPEMTVRQSHAVAHQVQQLIVERLDWVADVLVHVEPAGPRQ
jgi:cation diffusion facilitator family transporter